MSRGRCARGHVLGRLILRVDRRGSAAPRPGAWAIDLLLVGLRPPATMLRRVAARARHDVVAIGLGLVAQPLLVGARALHVAEGFDHLGRRIDLLQLHLGDLDARAVAVEHALHQVARRRSRSARAPRSALAGSRSGRSTSRMALSATALHGRVRVARVEQVGRPRP